MGKVIIVGSMLIHQHCSCPAFSKEHKNIYLFTCRWEIFWHKNSGFQKLFFSTSRWSICKFSIYSHLISWNEKVQLKVEFDFESEKKLENMSNICNVPSVPWINISWAAKEVWTDRFHPENNSTQCTLCVSHSKLFCVHPTQSAVFFFYVPHFNAPKILVTVCTVMCAIHWCSCTV